MIERKLKKTVCIGDKYIGGDHPITVQSMTNTDPADREKTLEQLRRLQSAGCDIARMTIPDQSTAGIFTYAKNNGITMPLVADIHFDYLAAIAAVKAGADKIRINPGNIGSEDRVREVATVCKDAGIPIRIGVNGGSLEKRLSEKYKISPAEALAESAFAEAEALEKCGFSDIVLSVKSSNVAVMNEAVRIIDKGCDYPLHLGVTEAGDDYSGLIKNSAGIGALLISGIGDTIRYSLTADPVSEVLAGRELLLQLGLAKGGIRVVSCPTCGRTKIDLIRISREYKDAIRELDAGGRTVTVAVMGCVVNGPGEAREADFGIAGGDGYAVFFRKGEKICRVEESEIINLLVDETKKYIAQ